MGGESTITDHVIGASKGPDRLLGQSKGREFFNYLSDFDIRRLRYKDLITKNLRPPTIEHVSTCPIIRWI